MTLITHEQLKQLLHYDPLTGVFTWRVFRSGKTRAGMVAGSVNAGDGYLDMTVLGRRYRGHRLVWLYMTGRWPVLEVDHIDGDHSNNRWGNLREATNAQQRQNTVAQRTNASGLLGVHWNKGKKRYCARIGVDGKSLHLGWFTDPLDASAAYKAAKADLHAFQPTPRR